MGGKIGHNNTVMEFEVGRGLASYFVVGKGLVRQTLEKMSTNCTDIFNPKTVDII